MYKMMYNFVFCSKLAIRATFTLFDVRLILLFQKLKNVQTDGGG